MAVHLDRLPKAAHPLAIAGSDASADVLPDAAADECQPERRDVGAEKWADRVQGVRAPDEQEHRERRSGQSVGGPAGALCIPDAGRSAARSCVASVAAVSWKQAAGLASAELQPEARGAERQLMALEEPSLR